MSKPRPIPSRDLVGIITAHLRKLGFWEVHKSRTGSRYLRLPEMPFQIRISDHEWSNFSRLKQPQVIRSVYLQPVPQSETWGLAVELAVRFMAACEARKRGLVCSGHRRDAEL